MAEIRQRIVFHGRVQGVGFRYTAKYLAQSLGLTGWVENEFDGTICKTGGAAARQCAAAAGERAARAGKTGRLPPWLLRGAAAANQRLLCRAGV